MRKIIIKSPFVQSQEGEVENRNHRLLRQAVRMNKKPISQKEYEVPILLLLSQQPGGKASAQYVISYLKETMTLGHEDRKKLSCGERRYSKSINWARYHLQKNGYMKSAGRGIWQITKKGAMRIGVTDLLEYD